MSSFTKDNSKKPNDEIVIALIYATANIISTLIVVFLG